MGSQPVEPGPLGGRLPLAKVVAGAGVAPDSGGASSAAGCGPRTSGLTALLLRLARQENAPGSQRLRFLFPQRNRDLSLGENLSCQLSTPQAVWGAE